MRRRCGALKAIFERDRALKWDIEMCVGSGCHARCNCVLFNWRRKEFSRREATISIQEGESKGS